MKRFLLAATALVGLAAIGSANAADLALKAPPPPAWYDWTGFYVGLNAGYSWGKSSTTYTVAGLAPFSTSQSMNGGLGGGQVGYNWQFNRNWLLGLEADIQGTGQKGTAALPTAVAVPGFAILALPTTTSTASLAQKLPWFGTVRARLGIEPTDHWLLYVTGGLAYGEVKSTGTVTASTAFPGGPVLATATATSTANTTRTGWTVGGGVEGVISGPWTAKLEYLYMDLGTFNNAFLGVGPSYPAIATSSHVTDNILRVGVNYRFPK
jgi:outer membrane immunogenic protein